jgi:hypothetical protein
MALLLVPLTGWGQQVRREAPAGRERPPEPPKWEYAQLVLEAGRWTWSEKIGSVSANTSRELCTKLKAAATGEDYVLAIMNWAGSKGWEFVDHSGYVRGRRDVNLWHFKRIPKK